MRRLAMIGVALFAALTLTLAVSSTHTANAKRVPTPFHTSN